MIPRAEHTPWMAFRASKPRARLRVFCIPYAGSGASIFRSLALSVPDSIDLCPIQLPGRESREREPPFSRLSPLVAAMRTELAPWLDLPYVLFGYSMGALVAFELARALRHDGAAEPRQLFVAGRRAPRRREPRPLVHTLPRAEFVQELVTYGATPPTLLESPDVLDFYLPLLRADFAVCETYEYRANGAIGCPITVYGGNRDPFVTRDDLDAWALETTGSCLVRVFEGGHFFLHSCWSVVLRSFLQDLSALIVG
jgi:medium-chain acyl-[acyl-carrier-protein] hydrolase